MFAFEIRHFCFGSSVRWQSNLKAMNSLVKKQILSTKDFIFDVLRRQGKQTGSQQRVTFPKNSRITQKIEHYRYDWHYSYSTCAHNHRL